MSTSILTKALAPAAALLLLAAIGTRCAGEAGPDDDADDDVTADDDAADDDTTPSPDDDATPPPDDDTTPPPDDDTSPNACIRTGCNSEICASESMVSPCLWEDWFTCLHSAACEPQESGVCGFTCTPALKDCLVSYGQPPC